ncbi:hypothetical protein [Aureispira anguillae]|uniref:Outer membrane protein beta-barrel domain-containing protein n=1 Tax=Aureispira anguillae TaxID=2864201 RepID=A0A915YHN6_9BACT|nr:hypothetical protein [Aureispira anguillae]BDS13253.1 hypothetical protein AsAng_0039830 [Aureispira anguillae]
MKRYTVLIFLLLGHTSFAQFSLEALIGTSLNMSIHRQYVSQINGPNFIAETHLAGGGLEVGFGGRLGFNDQLSFGLGLAYQYKGHEGNYIKSAYKNRTNSKYWFHLLVLPIDAQYTLPNQIGLHVGMEIATILAPWFNNTFLFYQNKAMAAALTGISYTKGRFRVELFYKHYFTPYMRQTIYLNNSNNDPVEFSDYNRFHDIQLRIAVRLFSLN